MDLVAATATRRAMRLRSRRPPLAAARPISPGPSTLRTVVRLRRARHSASSATWITPSGLVTAGTYASNPTAVRFSVPPSKSRAISCSWRIRPSPAALPFHLHLHRRDVSRHCAAFIAGNFRVQASGGCAQGFNLTRAPGCCTRAATPFVCSELRNTGISIYSVSYIYGLDAPGSASGVTYNVRTRGDGTNVVIFPSFSSSPRQRKHDAYGNNDMSQWWVVRCNGKIAGARQAPNDGFRKVRWTMRPMPN